MADVFSIDEANAAAEIRFYYATGQLDRASFKYGSLFYYVPLAAIHAYSVFDDISDRAILTLLRSYGAIAGVGCLLLT
ncbi:MAG: hypothetical protein VX910_00470, partial [Candidatus Latescibacterota bacterium]|nr:hypothetical protein [Candidatus Latescibacterota bacterium]